MKTVAVGEADADTCRLKEQILRLRGRGLALMCQCDRSDASSVIGQAMRLVGFGGSARLRRNFRRVGGAYVRSVCNAIRQDTYEFSDT